VHPYNWSEEGSKDLAKEQMQAEFRRAKDSSGIVLEVETLGMPEILPSNVVDVTGMGKRFDSKYTVFSVTHSLGSAGSSTKLELRGCGAFAPGTFGPVPGTWTKNPNETNADDIVEAAEENKPAPPTKNKLGEYLSNAAGKGNDR
jgi:hypothetical protein